VYTGIEKRTRQDWPFPIIMCIYLLLGGRVGRAIEFPSLCAVHRLEVALRLELALATAGLAAGGDGLKAKDAFALCVCVCVCVATVSK
jgi:hypothetical protein